MVDNQEVFYSIKKEKSMTTTSRRIAHRCVDCGKRIGWDYLRDVGIGIPMVIGEKITDKNAIKVDREVARNIIVKHWICGDCAKKELNKQG